MPAVCSQLRTLEICVSIRTSPGPNVQNEFPEAVLMIKR